MSRDASHYYAESLYEFDRAVLEPIRVSRAAAGRYGEEPRAWWASVLFTRLCTASVSLLHLAPASRFFKSPLNHYDSSATAALARNIMECYIMFFYLCVDPVSEEEWRARLNILYLNDCASRIRMFRDFNPEDPQLPLFEEQAKELRDRLSQIPFFSSLPSKRRTELLKGQTPFLLSRAEILTKLGIEREHFRAIYTFLSSHVHSFPLAFLRMGDGDRGRGVESEVEKGYIAMALELAEGSLSRAVEDMLRIFPDIPWAAKNDGLSEE